MDIEQLRQIAEVVNAGTSAAAAESLHVSQSALSRSIHRLEIELGVGLFDRTKNSMSLSDAGRELMPYFKALLADASALADAAERIARPARSLRVASCSLAPLWKLVPLVAERAPGLQVRPDLVPSNELDILLKTGSCDIAITPTAPEGGGLRGVPLMSERLFATFPVGHEMAARESVSFADLDGMTFLIYAGAGYWKDVCARRMPDSHYVVQDDYVLFSDLARTSPLPGFVTNVSRGRRDIGGRVAVPLSDAEGETTFHMVFPEGGGRFPELLNWLAKRVAI